jgi:hypothetical protein
MNDMKLEAQALERLAEENFFTIEEAIVDNKIELVYKDEKYRVRNAEFKEKNIAKKEKDKKFLQMLQATDENGKPIYMLREKLMAAYKKQGIDFKCFDDKIAFLNEKIEAQQLLLTEQAKENPSEEDAAKIAELKQNILKIRIDQYQESAKRSELLLYSIEDVCENHFLKSLIVNCSEKLVDDQWVRIFKSVEEMEVGEEELVNRLSACAMAIFFKADYTL